MPSSRSLKKEAQEANALILPVPTQTRNPGRAEHCLVVLGQWRWNRGVPRYWGLACRQNGPARATKYFSGNGIAVASMCAVLHQYRPPRGRKGGFMVTEVTETATGPGSTVFYPSLGTLLGT